MRIRSAWRPIPLVRAIALLFLAHLCFAQTDSLALSSGTAGANQTASLNLVLTSPAGSQPASIQFTLTYPAATVTSISVSPGPTATSAGKTVTCALASGAYTCLIYGLNAATISNGVVAVVNLAVTASVTIGIGNPVAASPIGESIPLFATGGAVTFQLALSVTPSSGTGSSQTFTFVYSDANGAGDLASAQAIINVSDSVASACYVRVTPATGAVWLANDNGTSWPPAPTTLGTGGTQQNSQCALNMAASSGTLSGNTYTLHIAISFLAGFAGTKSVYSYASTQSGFNSGWQILGSWTVLAFAPQAVSVTPSSGSGAGQTFSLVYNDANGAADLASAQVIVGASNSSVSACYVWVTPGIGAVWLANDDGTWPAAMTLGSAGTQQNSQCVVNVGSSSGSQSGNTYTLNLAISFQSGFSGAKNIYSLATSQAGLSSGWQTVGTWTAGTGSSGPAIHAVSVSPSSGSGASQTFTFVYTDSSGAPDLASAQAMINASISSVSSCYVWVKPGTGTIWLAGDAGDWPASQPLGSAGTLQNSQCAVNVGSSSGTLSGNTYTLNLAISFESGFSGAKNIYSLATNQAGLSSGWQSVGIWTAGTGSSGPAVHAVSVTPSSGSGATQTFTFVYTDSSGASDLASAQALINGSITGVSSCYVWVTPGTGTIWLAGDAGNWPGSLTLGTAGTLQNSQCAVNVGSSSATLSGNTYTLNLTIGFESGFSGSGNIYSLATSQTGLTSGWQTVGTWTAGAGNSGPAIHAVSVSPSSGSGTTQTFTFVYTDSNGAADLASAQAMVNASVTGVSSCYVWVTPGAGTIWLAGDAGNWLTPLTLGTAGTLQNSQCAVNVGSSSGTLSGNTYTLNLAIGFGSGFSGAKNIYSVATSQAGLTSGWQTVGTWTAGTVSGGPAIRAVSANPDSGSGGSHVFSFLFSDSSGASDLATVSALINNSTAESTACSVTYNRASNTLALLTDAGAEPSGTITPGGGSQQNSQCTLTGSASSVTASGNLLTLNLAIGFTSGFAGAKNVYLSAQSSDGASTGFQQLGTWTVTVITQGPQAVFVTPSSGSGASQTFTFIYTDVNGVLDIGSAQAMINASNSGVSSCYVWATPGTGAIWLAGDAGNWPAPLILGTAGTLQNSQCVVNVGSSSGALTGQAYTLILAISFQSEFSGIKNIYSYATSLGGLNSGWQTLGNWTPYQP